MTGYHPKKEFMRNDSFTITPTVFFLRDGHALKQRVDLTFEASSEATSPAEAQLPADGWVLIVLGPSGESRYSVPAGKSRHSIYLPDLRQAGQLEFTLVDGSGTQLAQQTMLWQPARHWTVYVNPSSHHDLGYTDLPSNVLREHDQFLDQVIEFCDTTADWPEEAQYHYTIEQAWSVLHYLARRSSQQAQRLVKQIQAGKIEVTALFGNETSELCSSEEQIRLLYPAFRLQRRLGIPIRTAELNDVPGVAWGLASVLAGAGIRYFAPGIPDYFNWGIKRPFIWDEAAVLPRDMPGAFWWEGPDGQHVLLWYEGPGLGWSGMWTLEQVESDLGSCLERLSARGYPFDILRARVQGGNRDNSPPDLRFSTIIREWNARWAYPKLVLSTSAGFFEAFEQRAGGQLKTLRGDLPGTDYPLGATSTPAATAANRAAHDSLAAGERLATIAALLAGLSYPAEQLAEAYDQMLLYDEHTWGMAHPTGAAQEACWSQKAQFAYRAAALAHDALSKSANRLADCVSLLGDEYAVVVFNPLAQARSDLAVVEALPTAPAGKPMHWQPGKAGQPAQWIWGNAVGRHLVTIPAALLEAPFELIDLATDQPVDCQVSTLVDPLAAHPHAAHRFALGGTDSNSVDLLNYDPSQAKELLFLAKDIPALGYKTYVIRTGQHLPARPAGLRAGEFWLENEYYRLEVDPVNGAVSSIIDKELGLELVDSSALYGFHQVVGRRPRTGETQTPSHSMILVGECGPVYASLVIKGEAPGCPQRTQEIRLYAGLKRIDFATRILRDATPMLELFLAFPFRVEQPEWRYEAPNAVQTPVADQLPGSNTHAYAIQHWVNIANAEVAVSWSSLDAPVAAFGQLWPSPISQAHHGATSPDFGAPYLRDPGALQPGHLYAYLSVSNFRTNFQPVQAGDVLFRFSLTSSAGGAGRVSVARDFGWAVCMPLVPANVRGPQVGTLPASGSFCTVDAPNVLLLGMKAAEDGDGVILRLAETEGRETACQVSLPILDIEQAWQTDLVERNITPVTIEGNTICVTVAANSACTIRCRGNQARFPTAEGWWYE
jgi:hypothetical protein